MTILYAFLGVAVLAVLLLCAIALFAGDTLDRAFMPLEDDELDSVGTESSTQQARRDW